MDWMTEKKTLIFIQKEKKIWPALSVQFYRKDLRAHNNCVSTQLYTNLSLSDSTLDLSSVLHTGLNSDILLKLFSDDIAKFKVGEFLCICRISNPLTQGTELTIIFHSERELEFK